MTIKITEEIIRIPWDPLGWETVDLSTGERYTCKKNKLPFYLSLTTVILLYRATRDPPRAVFFGKTYRFYYTRLCYVLYCTVSLLTNLLSKSCPWDMTVVNGCFSCLRGEARSTRSVLPPWRRLRGSSHTRVLGEYSTVSWQLWFDTSNCLKHL